MPVTAEDLWLINAGEADRAKLDKALDYIQTAMPINGMSAIEAFDKENVKVEINHSGRLDYDSSTRTINWTLMRA